ncbi:hypothetical protein DPMN_089210 [Dreissena polymorpha]|uniref:CCAAT-binding factor domain-containing protein n=1 Tax=Dreissena polymorpha TaxID=45954 RepID=A0A9D4KWE3_DREPO|nr:hypothetical protein DPMN_089210 [Dreissena polymorpha]
MDYDPYHRNPAYCHAENACMWELQGLAAHFHPTVALFARQILQGESIEYPGDPLQDFTLIRFLERFVFKNPKKKQQVEEKLGALSRVKSEVRGIKTLSVTSDTFANLEERIVPVDDVFLHRYFRQKLSRKTPARKRMMTAMETVSVILSLTPSCADVDFDIDFSSEFGKKKGDSLEDSDDEEEEAEDDDLSDEEVDLDDDELAKEFQVSEG